MTDRITMALGDMVLANGKVTSLAEFDVAGSPRCLTIKDIAEQLAATLRFSNMLARPVSVAEHSLAVARAATKIPPHLSGDQIMWALMHDAHEALIGDIPRPVKAAVMGNGSELERELDARIAALFGLYVPVICASDPAARHWWRPIQALDDAALAAEWEYFMPAVIHGRVARPVEADPLGREYYQVDKPSRAFIAGEFVALFERIRREFLVYPACSGGDMTPVRMAT